MIAALTLIAVPVFILEGQVAWAEASALVVGFSLGGEVGARLAVRGGERMIRPVLIAAVIAMMPARFFAASSKECLISNWPTARCSA